MFNNNSIKPSRESRKPLVGFMVGAAAILGVSAATMPAAMASPAMALSATGITLGDDDEDLLERLIEMDADDIEDLRAEIDDARRDIEDAVADIEEAREEASGVPGGGPAVRAALKLAAAVASRAATRAIDEVQEEIDHAERELMAMEGELSAEEFAETQYAIAVVREEIAELIVLLDELFDAMRA